MIRIGYTSMILKLSSYIERKKQKIIISRSLKSIFDVWLLIGAELLFTIVSLPLFLLTKKNLSRSSESLRIRRVLTRSVVLCIALLWLIKVGIILIEPWLNTKPHIEEGQTIFREDTSALPALFSARVNEAIRPPVLTQLKNEDGTSLLASGWTVPGMTVAVFVTNITDESPSTKILIGTVGTNGRFSISEEREHARTSPTVYTAVAVAFDPKTHEKSVPSPIVTERLQPTISETLLGKIDLILNITILTLLLGGIFLTILTI